MSPVLSVASPVPRGRDNRSGGHLPIRFFKMSGSGNDFIFFDLGDRTADSHLDEAAIAGLCARGPGVGADGVVLLWQRAPGLVQIAYYNSDGSRAALCGNATLCTARLAVHLGAALTDAPFTIRTDDGDLPARVRPGEDPSFQLRQVRDLEPDVPVASVGLAAGVGERRIGYAVSGVPHLVVWVDDVDTVDLIERGRLLRRATPERPHGANVNFVSRMSGEAWLLRTYERGVEAETLACGTGAVACAAVLRAWAASGSTTHLVTRSGRTLRVELNDDAVPVLGGEGRLVYEGVLHDWKAG